MLFVLMDSYKILVLREEFICKCPAYFHTCLRGYDLVFVEADDVMSIHSSGVFVPQMLFPQERLIDFIPVDDCVAVGTGNFYISFFDFVASEDIFDNVPHCSV